MTESLSDRADDTSDSHESTTSDQDDSFELEREQDDAVIGRAFRGSLAVFAGVAALALLVVWCRGGEDNGPGVAIDVEAPQQVEAAADPPPISFVDVTASSGIEWTHENGARGERLLPESMGAGAAFFDYDQDGDQDLFLLNSTTWSDDDTNPKSALYENDGAGRFTDRSREAGLDLAMYGAGVAVGDIDNDGYPELFLSAVGPNRLLHNREGADGDRRFVEIEAGVAGAASEWSSSATFFDADGDGDLDLFVGNYVKWSPEIDRQVDYRLDGVGKAYGPPVNYEGTYPYLYRNDGGLQFTDVSQEAGVRVSNDATGGPVAKSLGVLPVDLDGDHDTDLLVANDTVRNFVFRNTGDGTFEEVGELFGVAYGRDGNATGAMGIDAAHFRNDDDLGIAIGNFANEMTSLYVMQSDPTLYTDEAIGAGIGAPSRRMLSFGVFFFDVDLDGRLDLLQVNGHLETEIATVDPSQTYRQPAQLFWNAGDAGGRTFVPIEADVMGDLGRAIVGRGSAFADVDGDGDLDVVLLQTGAEPLLLRNDTEHENHWLRVKVIGDGQQVNGEGIGSWIELEAGGSTQKRPVLRSRSYQSQSEVVVTFGLGSVDSVSSLAVIWPDGERQTVAVAGVDRLVEVTREP